MRLNVLKTWTCVIALLVISSLGHAAPVRVDSNGITFPDNSVQSKAAVMPSCSPGEVIVNNVGSWVCGTMLPVDKGIATCVNVSNVCTMSACQPGWGNCDTDVTNGCEAALSTNQNCGACGITCGAGEVCTNVPVTGFSCVVSPNSPASITVSGTPTAGFVGGQKSVTVTANVQKVSGGPVPQGTVVNFAITGGTGTLSSPTATTNSSGDASVTLNSTAEGVVTVTATAAPATGTTGSSISFSNPNKPGAVTLATSPGTGITGGNTPVTLTATVAPADAVNGVIANGTTVTFNIVSGSGTLSTATATTLNGVASVTLNSSVPGDVGVTASAGTSPVVTSATKSVPFIVQPTVAIVKVATTGTLPANSSITGINAIITANPSSGLSITASAGGGSPDVVASGVNVGSAAINNTNNVASVILGLVNAGGIPVGEFDTVTYHIAPGTFPTAGNFSIAFAPGASLIVSDNTSGNTVSAPGIGLAILSVTIQ